MCGQTDSQTGREEEIDKYLTFYTQSTTKGHTCIYYIRISSGRNTTAAGYNGDEGSVSVCFSAKTECMITRNESVSL